METKQSVSDPVAPAVADAPPAGQDAGDTNTQLPPDAPAAPATSATLSLVKSAPTTARPTAPRPLKLVLTLKPAAPAASRDAEDRVQASESAGGDNYHALVSVGTDGCDPLLRSVGAQALSGILDDVPCLVAEAEAQWARQPRFPRAAARQGTRFRLQLAPPTAMLL